MMERKRKRRKGSRKRRKGEGEDDPHLRVSKKYLKGVLDKSRCGPLGTTGINLSRHHRSLVNRFPVHAIVLHTLVEKRS